MYVGLSALLEAVALILVMPVTQRLGRRPLMGAGSFACGSLLLVNLFIPEGMCVFLYISYLHYFSKTAGSPSFHLFSPGMKV